MLSLIPSVVALGLVAVAAAYLAARRGYSSEFAAERINASHALTVATAVQGIHFAEEWATGFHAKFPALFGLEPMSLPFFAGFNLVWIAIWIAAIRPLRDGTKLAFFAAWFLALAGMLNGLAHPLMAVAAGGYFPGLLSSPFIGLAGVYLAIRLHRASASAAA